MSEQDPTIFDPPEEKKPESGNRFRVSNAIWTIIAGAVIAATLFTLWTPANLFSNQSINQLFQAWQADALPAYPTATAMPSPRIGIVAGHYGSDSGAVCDDGLTEMQVNLALATRVQQKLRDAGYQVDLLQEFDERLSDYQALALISIHNDTCKLLGPEFTGFKVAAAASNAYPERATRLRECMIARYGAMTGMTFHESTVTIDMTNYHTFGEIHPDTTAAIIETGFLGSATDRAMLTQQPDLVANAIVAGVLCYIRNENIVQVTATPLP